jgi:hypothetical protein
MRSRMRREGEFSMTHEQRVLLIFARYWKELRLITST